MDSKWLENILSELHQDAYQWARQCCLFDDEKAKDVLQVVYLKILEGKAKYHKKSAFKTWLFSVIRFTAIDYEKKNPELTSLETEPIAVMEIVDSELNYQKIIELLPEKQKQVMLLVFYHGLTLEESSEIMDVSLGTVRTHYDRGKKKLKELISKQSAHEN